MNFKKYPTAFLLVSIFLFSIHLYSQPSLKKNKHVKISSKVVEDTYIIHYTFKDQFLNMVSFEITFPKETTDAMISQFGVPNWVLKRYIDTPLNRAKRNEAMVAGMFKEENNTIEIDYNAVVMYYSPFCKPIANSIVNVLTEQGKDNRKNRIEMTMRFIQDIPYRVPPSKNSKKYLGGIFTPPQLLIKKYGDCDSKALLFVGILCYLIDSDDILFLHQKDHLLTAIKGEPGPGDTYVGYNNEAYLLAETAGPGSRKLGEKGSYFQSRFTIQPLEVTIE